MKPAPTASNTFLPTLSLHDSLPFGRPNLPPAKVVRPPIAVIPAGLFQDNKPNRIGIEWYASPADLARVMDWLRRHTETGPAAEARRILGLNPGIPADAASHWAYVGYKGGSEPGVLDKIGRAHV